MSSTFERHREAWSHPPVDGVGYISSGTLLELPDDELHGLISDMETERYSGWRNTGGHWREILGLDSTTDKLVLDYGCGTGIEALQYAKAGNHVILADIAPSNVTLASRVLALFGYGDSISGIFLRENPPRADIAFDHLDVVHCAGVLHHIEDAESAVAEIANWLKPGGELRLMVYSDVSWRRATDTAPPKDVRKDPRFEQYVKAMDGVGEYADWYDRTRLVQRFGDFLTLARCEYLDANLGYIGAVLRKR